MPQPQAANEQQARNAEVESRAILLVANPTSGNGRGARTAEAVADRLERDQYTVCVAYTRAAGEGESITAEALARTDETPLHCVVACGGDGTVQEVANALASFRREGASRCPSLALAPAGRCNDFARALGVSTDPTAIGDVISRGVSTPVDLGSVNGRFFCTVATLGIDAEVARFVDRGIVLLRGTAAYIYGAARVLATYRAKSVRLEGDFGVIEGPVFLASTANTSSYGGSIIIAPDAVPTDGLLDLCIVDVVPRWRAPWLVLAILRNRHRHHRHVRFIRTSTLDIASAEPLEIWADGEPIATTPATIKVHPGAIEVLLADGAGGATGSNR